MAAAEARAAWQRTANRYFVQEDAKRAPKLACVPPSSSTTSKQVDTRPPTNGNADFTPPTANSLYSNLSPDSRWWLQLHPNYLHQTGLTNEKVNTEEMEESYEFVEMDSGYKEVDEFNLGSGFPHWMESEKNHELPWWRMADKDDLASYVAQKSHDFIENCDLPTPRHASFKKDPYGDDRAPGKQNAASPDASSGPVSAINTESGDSPFPEVSRTPEKDPSKRKLLEALCHSQTRAREAEKAAKQAYDEKEHVVKLIFKQASQLFAYKQWVYLLQLENLYNQLKTNKITPVLPAYPRRKTRKKLDLKHRRQEKHVKHVPSCKHDLGVYAVAFAVGLGLVGAGLLLGWTVGWMFI